MLKFIRASLLVKIDVHNSICPRFIRITGNKRDRNKIPYVQCHTPQEKQCFLAFPWRSTLPGHKCTQKLTLWSLWSSQGPPWWHSEPLADHRGIFERPHRSLAACCSYCKVWKSNIDLAISWKRTYRTTLKRLSILSSVPPSWRPTAVKNPGQRLILQSSICYFERLRGNPLPDASVSHIYFFRWIEVRAIEKCEPKMATHPTKKWSIMVTVANTPYFRRYIYEYWSKSGAVCTPNNSSVEWYQQPLKPKLTWFKALAGNLRSWWLNNQGSISYYAPDCKLTFSDR